MTSSVTRILVAAILVGVDTSFVWAQATPPTAAEQEDKILEELMSVKVASVYGAARHEQRSTEAPSSVTIITAADIETFGWRTLSEVMQSVRGFYVTNDRNYSYVGARGFGRPSDYNNRILVLVNGHRYNDNVYDAASVGSEFAFGVDLIERIEVIRGPGSALYGTSAFFAVINIITRHGAGERPVEVTAEVGSLGTYTGRATAGWTRPGVDALFSVTGATSDGVSELYFPELDSPETNGGIAIDRDGETAGSIFGTVTFKGVTIEGAHGSRDKDLPTASYDSTFNDPRNRTTDARGWIDVSRRFLLGGADVTARGSYDWMRYEGTYVLNEGQTPNRDFSSGDWLSGEVVASRRVRTRHVLTAGMEYRRNVRQDQWAYDEPVPEVRTVDAQYDSHQWGMYAQAEIGLHPRVTATVGGRYDRWSFIGGAGRPRLGLVVTPSVNNAFKLLYGGAYRAPNVFELFYYSDGSQSEEPLRPESLSTIEGVFEQYLGGRLRFTGTIFRTAIKDLITQGEFVDGAITFLNRDRARANGGELEAEARFANGVLVRGSYSHQRVTDGNTGDPLANAPRHLAGVNVAVPLAARAVTLASDMTYVGSRLTLAGLQVDGAWVANANVRFRPRGSRMTISAGVRNLFDTEYTHPVGVEFVQHAIEQNGRTAIARMTVRF